MAYPIYIRPLYIADSPEQRTLFPKLLLRAKTDIDAGETPHVTKGELFMTLDFTYQVCVIYSSSFETPAMPTSSVSKTVGPESASLVQYPVRILETYPT